MNLHDRFDELPKKRGMSRSRPTGQKRRGAEREIERLAWLDWPLVYWSGNQGRERASSASDREFRSLADLVTREVAGRPASLLAVDWDFTPEKAPERSFHHERLSNPAPRIVAVTPSLLDLSARGLTRLRRYPVQLPKLIEDPLSYLEEKKERLRLVSDVRDSVDGDAEDPLAALALEEHAVWLGDDGPRPSRSIPRERVQGSVADSDGLTAGARLAAILLGRWGGAAGNLPRPLVSWARVGSALNRWPVDLVARLPEEEIRRLLATLRGPEVRAAFNGPGPAETYREICLLGRAHSISLADFLQSAILLEDAVEMVREEPERRKRGFLSEIDYAVERRVRESAARPERERLLIRTGLAGPMTIEDEWLPPFERWRWKSALLFEELEAWLGAPLGRPPPRSPSPPAARLLYEQVSGLDLTVERGDWARDLTVLAARIAARAPASPVPLLRDLWRWVDRCRRNLPPGAGGASAVDFALEVLDRTLPYTSWESRHVGPLLEALGRAQVGEILLGGRSWRHDEMAFARLGELGSEARSTLLSTRLPENEYLLFLIGVRGVLEERPEALESYLLWVRENPSSDHVREMGKIFSAFEPDTVREILRWDEEDPGWVRDLGADDGVGQLLYGLAGDALARPAYEIAGFLRSHPWSLRRLRAFLPAAAASGFDMSRTEEIADAILCTRLWREVGWAKPRSLLKDLLHTIPREARRPAAIGLDAMGFLVRVSGGDAEAMRALFEHRAGLRELDSEEIARLSRLLDANPATTELLRELSKKPRLAPSVVRVLLRASLVARLPDVSLDRSLGPEAEADLTDVPLPVRRKCDEALLNDLRILSALRRSAGHDALPSAIRKILSRRQALAQEKAFLDDRVREGEATEPMRLRHRKIEGWLEDPDRVSDWIVEDLRKAMGESLADARLERLEAAVDEPLRSYLRSITGADREDFDSDRWGNALRLCFQLNKLSTNRRLLTRLLTSICRDGDDWPRTHPENRRFLDRAAERGLDMEPWLEPRRESFDRGGQPLTLYVERDPLRILEMGNLFDTCVSVGDFNAFATVATAVEINKAVVYVLDSKEHTIGRKIIALSPDGELIGFKSYGAAGSPWIKIALDLFCRKLADEVGATLRFDKEGERDLDLFAQSHLDSEPVEPFDWWIRHLGADDPHQTVIRELDRHIDEAGEDGPSEADVRALLWLGDRAD